MAAEQEAGAGWGRRWRGWAGVALVVVALVGGWAGPASASPQHPAQDEDGDDPPPDPDDPDEATTRCPIDFDAPYMPDWPVQQQAESTGAAISLILSLGQSTELFNPTLFTVRILGPAWYVDEALAEADDGNCALAVNRPTGNCDLYRPIELPRYGPVTDADLDADDGSPPPMIDRDVPRNGGMTSMLPDNCWGEYPADAYRIHYRADGFWSFDEKVFGIATGTIHAIGKGSMQVGLAMMDFGFATFRIVDYKRIALTAATNYDTKLVGPLGLVEIAWFVLFAYAAIQALRGKLGIAGGEIAMSIVLVTLASVLMANREGYLDGVADTTDRLTSSVLSAGAGRRPSDSYNPYDTLQPLQRTLFDEFVDRPFDYIHFGGEITEPACRQRRDRILYANVPKDHGWGSRYMADGGDECREYARSMGETTPAKMLMASITTVVCFAVAFSLAAMSFTMALAKVLVMGVFVAAPFAAVAAPFPGTMRRLAWSWFSILIQAVLTAVAMALLLSIFVLGIDGVVDNTETMGTFERWLVMLVIVAIIFLLRRHLLDGTRRASSSIGDTLTRLSPAAAHWQGSGMGGGGGGGGGLDLRAGERTLGSYGGAHAPMIGLAGVGAVGGLVATGWGRRATGKRALRNLVYMEDKKAVGGRALPRNRLLRRVALPMQRARGLSLIHI